ncbi:hypothetical protein ACGF5C_03440 [Micromonospora sp. NPDC047620]
MIPAIFRARAASAVDAGRRDAAVAQCWAGRMTGALIGIAGAVGPPAGCW